MLAQLFQFYRKINPLEIAWNRYQALRAKQFNAAPPEWIKVPVGPLAGRELLLNPRGPAFREMIEATYDDFFREADGFEQALEGGVIWDVGAHIGYHALCFTQAAGPRARVFAFEPNPFNVERFQRILERNSDLAEQIEILDCALSDADGEQDFKIGRSVDNLTSMGGHLTRVAPPLGPQDYAEFETVRVSTARADTLLRDKRVQPPTIVKIDVEGAEYLVLLGAAGILKKFRPLLLIEVHHILMMFQVQRLLAEAGYTPQLIGEKQATVSRCFIAARRL